MCNELSVFGESTNEEDQVIQILPDFPDCYNVLVTALEASAKVTTTGSSDERSAAKDKNEEQVESI